MQKAAQKAEAAEMKKLQKEKQKWEKGKFALKSIVAEIDAKVIELGSVGGEFFPPFQYSSYYSQVGDCVKLLRYLSYLQISCAEFYLLTLGHLLTRFAEKGLTYRITSNPIERSIVWTMTVPEHISQVRIIWKVPKIIMFGERRQ